MGGKAHRSSSTDEAERILGGSQLTSGKRPGRFKPLASLGEPPKNRSRGGVNAPGGKSVCMRVGLGEAEKRGSREAALPGSDPSHVCSSAVALNGGGGGTLRCPQCGSVRLYRDGFRYLADGSSVQRWLCRGCGYRFSQPKVGFNVVPQVSKPFNPGDDNHEKRVVAFNRAVEESSDNLPFSLGEDVASHNFTVAEKGLNSLPYFNSKRRVCVSEGEAKNLAEAETRQERAAGATEAKGEVKGKIVEFLWELKKQGLKEQSIKTYHQYLLQLIKQGANLLDPESVKEAIAKQSWSENTKMLVIASYTKFLEVHGGSWSPPKCKRVRKLPFVPLESELDQLISGANRKMSAFLMLLKETGMRSGEALRLKWKDIDFKNQTVTLNEPEKCGKPRMFKISSNLIAVFNALPKADERVFGPQNPRNYGRIYQKYRNRMAFKLQNPRLKKISFHTFRHWKATMEYHKTKDILHVMEMLGHRDIKTTLIYTQLIRFEGDEYHSATAKNVDEARKLIEAGFEYVCSYEGVMLFRKRK